MNRKKRNKLERKMRLAIIVAFGIYIVSTLAFNSIENALNIQVQRVEEEVEVMKAQRDGLNTAREDKISFTNIVNVAKNKGYTLNYALNQSSAKNE